MKLCIITTFSFNVWSNLKIKNKINTFLLKNYYYFFFYNTGNVFLQNLFYFIIIWGEFFTPQNN